MREALPTEMLLKLYKSQYRAQFTFQKPLEGPVHFSKFAREIQSMRQPIGKKGIQKLQGKSEYNQPIGRKELNC